ncbi:MAG: undecaprenyl-diphosphate phosphatase [Erysipelothrix sp.]|nr:undecaprenyl-diphosphate phosphatase [Erysipelothrix sp.]
MEFIEILKVIFLGIVEGITEWLPISSTGHMILVDEFIKLNVSPQFMEMFLVVIQLGAVMAVVVLYWNKLFPFSFEHGIRIKKDSMTMWFKILVASIPAGVIGVLFDDVFNELFFNPTTVAIMLILFGVIFIVVEDRSRGKRLKVNDISEITYYTAFLIGVFQLIAAIFPGVSRSGATIIGALILGVSRVVGAEFTFFLAIPAMFGGSALKLVKFMKFAGAFSGAEIVYLGLGTVVAFVVSIFALKFLVGYVKKHDFTVFGWYRIALGIVVLLYFYVF